VIRITIIGVDVALIWTEVGCKDQCVFFFFFLTYHRELSATFLYHRELSANMCNHMTDFAFVPKFYSTDIWSPISSLYK